MKPFLYDKMECKPKISLVNGNNIFANGHELAETFNSYFKEAVSKLDIQENKDITDRVSQFYLEDPAQIAIEKYKNHPSILKIIKMVTTKKEFNFSVI